jgi:hypothetical protein
MKMHKIERNIKIMNKFDNNIKIWVLFSIANDYNQPENNVVAWWASKPTIQQLASIVGIVFDEKKGSVTLGKILRGEEIRFGNSDYRLRKITEGRVSE